MDVGLLESMAQDEIPEQEMLNEQEQFPPQTDPEPEMGAVAAEAAEYDTPPPPHLRQIPSPAPSETETDGGGSTLLSPLVIAQMVEMITQAMRGETQQMGKEMVKKMEMNACRMQNKMEANTNKMEKCGVRCSK